MPRWGRLENFSGYNFDRTSFVIEIDDIRVAQKK